eukprot:scaffold5611_cov48-Phaeocystis_antarctica.AAC.3
MSSLLALDREIAYCRVARRAYGGRPRCTHSVQRRARMQIGGRARGGAHVEYEVHARDAGGVEAQRLVERRRGLPRVEWRAYGAVGGVARNAGGGGRPRCTHSLQGRARLQIGGRARGGAHVEHEVHARDAGGVEAQRLVERPRALPRVERRAYGAVGGVAREAGGGGRSRCKQGAGEGSTARLGAGHGEERTMNMRTMVVTLEVSKLSG